MNKVNSVKWLCENLVADSNKVLTCSARPSKRPFLPAQINSVSVQMLYDTGADISAISEKCFRQISPENRPEKLNVPHHRDFRSAGGQTLHIRGQYNLNVIVGKKTIKHPFYVIRDLNEDAILGIDFIQANKLSYCPDRRSFSWNGGSTWHTGHMKLCSVEVLPALSTCYVRVCLITEGGCLPGPDNPCLAQVVVPNQPLITSDSALVTWLRQIQLAKQC